MNSQTSRLIAYLKARPWQVIPSPQLNAAAAGPEAIYVSAYSKRISEARSAIQAQGGDLVLAYDRREGQARHTGYRYIPPKSKTCRACGKHLRSDELYDCRECSDKSNPINDYI